MATHLGGGAQGHTKADYWLAINGFLSCAQRVKILKNKKVNGMNAPARVSRLNHS